MPEDPMTKTRQGWDFKVASLSYSKGKPSARQCDSLFPHVPSALQVPLPPRCGVPHGSWALGGMGRGRAAREATEKESTWAGGRMHSQPGPGCMQPKLGAGKLLLFTRQLCRSRRQSRASPGLRPDFGKRWVLTHPGPGTETVGLKPVGAGGGFCCLCFPPPAESQTRKPLPGPPHHEPMGGYGCSHVTDGETEAPRLNSPGSGRPSQASKPGLSAAFSPHRRVCWPEPLPMKEQSGSWAQSSGKRMKRSSPNYWGPRL